MRSRGIDRGHQCDGGDTMNGSLRGRAHGRGLTLLEVLVATAILAVLAGAVVPSIAQALARLRSRAEASIVDIADLAAVADRFIAEPEAFEKGLSASKLHEIEFKQINWPTDDRRFEKFT